MLELGLKRAPLRREICAEPDDNSHPEPTSSAGIKRQIRGEELPRSGAEFYGPARPGNGESK